MSSKPTPVSADVSRRDFLRISALAGMATFGMPAILHAQNGGTKLNVAVVGLGTQGCNRLRDVMGCGVNIVAFCDVDAAMIKKAKEEMVKKDANFPVESLAVFEDYRKMLAECKNLDAVIITTPDHWHAPIAKAAMLAGKHVFCEKPLTHTISEARELRELAAKSKVVTQMGNQGSETKNMRRAIELIQAGVLGQVKEVHCWARGTGAHPGLAMPTEGDPVPAGFNWDAWVGPAPLRPFKAKYYHPWNWRGWHDFGSGAMGDFGCHNLNLPFRALELDYPTSIDVDAQLMGLPTYPKDARIRYDFAQRGKLSPVTVWWYDGGRRPASEVIPAALTEHLGGKVGDGVLIIGEKGFTFGGCWSGADYIKLNDEEKLSGILNHAASKSIPETLPHSVGHVKEWVEACMGKGKCFSDFETGGHLTEIALSGVVALRTGKKLQWNGPAMKATNAPEADQYIYAKYRKGWV